MCANVSSRHFTPRLRVKSLEELNVWLLDKCIAYAKAHRHPEQTERMNWQLFEEERGSLVHYAGPFDGFHCVPEAACQEALDHGVCSASVILNILARRRDPAPAVTLQIPDALRLTHKPVADCACYDSLRWAS